jgi:tectonic-1/3
VGGVAPAATDKLAIARSAAADAAAVFTDGAAGVGTAGMGLTLRGPAPDGTCVAYDAAAAAGTDAALPVPVRFGEDMAFACAMSLTPAQLQALCGASPAALLSRIGLGTVAPPGANRTAFTHIGVLGNADPFKAWQWLALQVSTPTAAATFDAVASRCDGLVTEVDVEFLTARVGEVHNPQPKIIAARVKYATGAWAYTREDVRGGVLPVPPQAFRLLTTVTWTEYAAQTTSDYIPPAPPVIPPLPSDLFYPFVRSTGAADSALTVSAAPAAAALHTGAAAGAALAGMAMLAAALAAGRDE